jgi:hypothetical protein
MPRSIAELERELYELSKVDRRGVLLRPARDWTDLAAITTCIVCEVEFADIGAVYRAVFSAPDPESGALALLDAVWDQDVVLGESNEE